MNITFHRAFDEMKNSFAALEEIIVCGFERILTSGQKKSATEGAELISELISKANERIIIMPGGGVRPENISELKLKSGAKEFHSSGINAGTLLPDKNTIELLRNKKSCVQNPCLSCVSKVFPIKIPQTLYWQ